MHSSTQVLEPHLAARLQVLELLLASLFLHDHLLPRCRQLVQGNQHPVHLYDLILPQKVVFIEGGEFLVATCPEILHQDLHELDQRLDFIL